MAHQRNNCAKRGNAFKTLEWSPPKQRKHGSIRLYRFLGPASVRHRGKRENVPRVLHWAQWDLSAHHVIWFRRINLPAEAGVSASPALNRLLAATGVSVYLFCGMPWTFEIQTSSTIPSLTTAAHALSKDKSVPSANGKETSGSPNVARRSSRGR